MSELSGVLRVNGLRCPDYGKLLVDAADALWNQEQEAAALKRRISELEALLSLLDNNYETSRNTDPESGGGIVVYKVNGNWNDREWTVASEGDTAEDALRLALTRSEGS